jgi:hypothetical protein
MKTLKKYDYPKNYFSCKNRTNTVDLDVKIVFEAENFHPENDRIEIKRAFVVFKEGGKDLSFPVPQEYLVDIFLKHQTEIVEGLTSSWDAMCHDFNDQKDRVV